MTGKLMLVAPQGCLCVLTMRQPASPKQVIQERERDSLVSFVISPQKSHIVTSTISCWLHGLLGGTNHWGLFWRLTTLQDNSWICFMVLMVLMVLIFGKRKNYNFNQLKIY